ncbi:DNA polymerase alpha/epsilon subunit B-domain-containing protein [Kalaharituber pfeilii]|nr:DNA polymerase alpha/epsilon subunit B-domain-containing protein [Kalaharituber pfeilii]
MAAADAPETDDLLRPPQSKPEALHRLATEHKIIATYTLNERTYQQQFSDIYFLRLAKLKGAVEEIAQDAWDGISIAGEKVKKVDRVLDVRQGEVCWVTGTVYMDMPLKPNILEDISKDHWLAAPPAREKYVDPANDQTMLEDESGRIKLIGGPTVTEPLVTGCVVAVLGSEAADGSFEVVDLVYPDLAPQSPPKRAGKSKRRGPSDEGRYVAIVSGLKISGELHESLETHLLVEYLLGELTGVQDQQSASKITRLILAGNSLSDAAPLASYDDPKTKTKKYGYDSSAYNPLPITALDNLLCSLLPSISVDIMPGDTDPANVSLPQQPIHPTMFANAKAYLGSTLNCVTNPYHSEIDGVEFVGTSGQTIDDIYKYVEGDDRLGMIERTLRWRHIAPTCPDTLWSYPFQNTDPFVLERCPHVYFVGNQPRFETKVVKGRGGETCRIVAVPRFAETGEVVLVDLETLDCEVMKISVEGMERVVAE